MRRGSKRVVNDTEKSTENRASPSKLTRDQVERIRTRRDDIRKRVGILSDSVVLIRKDRDR
jgi:hypothetical protein